MTPMLDPALAKKTLFTVLAMLAACVLFVGGVSALCVFVVTRALPGGETSAETAPSGASGVAPASANGKAATDKRPGQT